MQPTSIEIIKQLKKHGHEAYWAGGCVRDMLLGIEPKDFDIVTSAKPDQIEDILDDTMPVGKKFGVILAKKNGHTFEVATFRSDSGYSDGRRPDYVEFTSADKDAHRRDFTINGIFYDPTNDLIHDYVQGQKDLNAKVIRFIGDAEKRILEDHLRILRAVRFKNQFNFQYEPKTFQALKKHAPLVVDNIANERIGDELNKIIMLPNACEAFEDMEDLGILQVLLPEIQAMKGVAQPMEYHTEGDVWDHTMLALKSLPETTQMPVKWAVLLHDSGKPETFEVKERIRFDHHVEASGRIARSVLKRLRFSKRTVEEVAWLVEHHMMMVPLTEMPDSRKRHWFLHPYFLNLMQLFKADAEGTKPTNLSLYEKIYDLYHKHTKEMPKEPEPLLSGHDVMVITGIKPGPKVGEIMEQMREKQLGNELKNKEDAINWLKENACKDDC